MKPKYIDVQQGTQEWLDLRAGKITSSKMGLIMANYGKALGEPAKKYASDLALERITGRPICSDFSNFHMQRGIDQEPVARMIFEDERFCKIENGGFFDGGNTGASPDGLYNSGSIEIKSVIPSTHFASIKRGSFDPSYKWQLYSQLMFTELDLVDFVSYCQDYPEGKQLFIVTIGPDEEIFEMMRARIEEFEGIVSEFKEIIQESNYTIDGK